ncbi:hypothetical protein Q4577_20590 [Marinovum sp. 2_MG-2023]|uniref:hypothetical protein n=1 Tax=unclassified Marinovum TaxID=2647166 RepID=UPI0026E21EAF|nr:MULTISPECIES: hypothetical protein [unclassified Marinovum]MDO6732434.1 hypothetical protein [Marinovum sp. 2_MG-2023]MDO6781733.1 hypothetical protein [Marinovum sp. 1_MG-2023]
MYDRAKDRAIGRAPDYTTACVVMFGVNLGWILIALLASFGLAAVLLAGVALNLWINRLARRRQK